MGDADLAKAEALGEIGDSLHLGGGGIARDTPDRLQGNGNRGMARLPMGTDAMRRPGAERGIIGQRDRRGRGEGRGGEMPRDACDNRGVQAIAIARQAGEFRLNLAPEFGRLIADQDLDAGAIDIRPLAFGIVDPEHGFEVGEQLLLRQEFTQPR